MASGNQEYASMDFPWAGPLGNILHNVLYARVNIQPHGNGNAEG
jgi:hypothetical protein